MSEAKAKEVMTWTTELQVSEPGAIMTSPQPARPYTAPGVRTKYLIMS